MNGLPNAAERIRSKDCEKAIQDDFDV